MSRELGMTLDPAHGLAGEAGDLLPARRVVERAKDRLARARVPRTGLELVARDGKDIRIRSALDEHSHAVHEAHAGLLEQDVVDVRRAQRLTEGPPGRAVVRRRERVDRRVQALLQPLPDRFEILLAPDDHAGPHVNGLVARPVDLARGAEWPALVDPKLDLRPSRVRLVRVQDL